MVPTCNKMWKWIKNLAEWLSIQQKYSIFTSVNTKMLPMMNPYCVHTQPSNIIIHKQYAMSPWTFYIGQAHCIELYIRSWTALKHTPQEPPATNIMFSHFTWWPQRNCSENTNRRSSTTGGKVALWYVDSKTFTSVPTEIIPHPTHIWKLQD